MSRAEENQEIKRIDKQTKNLTASIKSLTDQLRELRVRRETLVREERRRSDLLESSNQSDTFNPYGIKKGDFMRVTSTYRNRCGKKGEVLRVTPKTAVVKTDSETFGVHLDKLRRIESDN